MLQEATSAAQATMKFDLGTFSNSLPSANEMPDGTMRIIPQSFVSRSLFPIRREFLGSAHSPGACFLLAIAAIFCNMLVLNDLCQWNLLNQPGWRSVPPPTLDSNVVLDGTP